MKSNRIVIFPYKMTSQGAKLLAAQLTTMEVECIRVYADRDYAPRKGDFIFFWGAGHPPTWMQQAKDANCTIINPSDAICRSVDKLRTFRAFKDNDVPTVPWTQNQSVALSWSRDGKWVCCRQSIEGMDGAGLILAKKEREMVNAGLFTQFIPNEREFRVYVYDDETIDVLEKHPDDESTDKHIRTEGNHYIYTRPSLASIPHCTAIQNASKKAAAAIGLTFAGVDVILGDDGKPYVLETNTAPGIGAITAKRIANAVKEAAGL